MKVTQVDVIPVRMPRMGVFTIATYGSLSQRGGGYVNFVLVKVHTDEGITGLGEAPPLPPLSPESQPVITEMIRNWIAPQVLGEDPFDLERINQRMEFVAPINPMSRAPIDMALWDIIGKKLGLPVHRLLGGAQTSRFPIVGLLGLNEEKKTVADGLAFVKAGYTGLRLKIAPGQDTVNLKALREAVGGDVTIRVDPNQSYGSVAKAVKAIKAMERYDIELVEQPTPWWDFKTLAEVAKRVDTPIMPHESLFTVADFKSLYDMGAIGVLGLKTYRPHGGITNARRLLDAAKLLGIPCLFHDDVELGVSLHAASHLIAARQKEQPYKPELSGYPEWFADDVVTKPFHLTDGYVDVPQGPGLGVELDEEKLRKYAQPTVVCK